MRVSAVWALGDDDEDPCCLFPSLLFDLPQYPPIPLSFPNDPLPLLSTPPLLLPSLVSMSNSILLSSSAVTSALIIRPASGSMGLDPVYDTAPLLSGIDTKVCSPHHVKPGWTSIAPSLQ